MNKEHIKKIHNSLDVLELFNKKKINYRALGSILIAALNHKPHRTIGDVDILLDKRDRIKAFKLLKNMHFTFEEKKKLGFTWIEAKRFDTLTFTFLLVGDFYRNYFSYKLTGHCELTISNSYLYPSEYVLYGRTFIGIPLESVYTGIKISNLNPKRKLDKQIIENILQDLPRQNISITDTFRVYLFRVRIPYLYPSFSYFYNLYGGLRVLLHKHYEVWG